MKTKFKKTLLILGAVSVLTIPAFAVSCGESKERANTAASVYFQLDKDGKNNYYNPQTKVLDLTGSELKEIKAASFTPQALAFVVIKDDAWRSQVFDPETHKIVIKKVIIPSTVEKIQAGAFLETGIEEVEFADNGNLESIEDDAFSGNNLTTLKLPSTLKRIGASAFSFNKLTSVDLGGVYTLPASAFYGNQLSDIDLKNIKIVSENALAKNNFTALNLPASVKQFSPTALDDPSEKEHITKISLTVADTELKKALSDELAKDSNHSYKLA